MENIEFDAKLYISIVKQPRKIRCENHYKNNFTLSNSILSKRGNGLARQKRRNSGLRAWLIFIQERGNPSCIQRMSALRACKHDG